MNVQTVPPMLPHSSAAIIICCYTDRRWTHLCAAIRSSLGQKPAADEVVAVVDHNPALAERLRQEGFEGLRIVENTDAPGLSGARNSGIAATRSDLLLFLDDDAIADPDLLACLAARSREHGVLGAVSAIRPLWEVGRPFWFPDEFLWTLGCTYRGLRPGSVRNLIGAAMCVRREVFEAVGGFHIGLGRTRSSLPLGCEETELCIRAGRCFPKARFVFDPSTGCDHAIPAARSKLRYVVKRCWAEGLSKAQLGLMSGREAALASERTYVSRTLPAGILKGLGDTLRGRPAGLAAAGTIILAFAATFGGYGLGRVLHALAPERRGGQDAGLGTDGADAAA